MNMLNYAIPQGCARRDIATLIFPETQNAVVAVARLNRWIHADPLLLSTLLENGYRKGIHWFTPRIVRVLKRFFL
jgi:hypothetical protein